jgi:hypothetical protein
LINGSIDSWEKVWKGKTIIDCGQNH